MKDGFYTALGTPLDSNGNFIPSSFKKQIEDQLTAGASGLLALGSMGIQPYIKDRECLKVATAAVEVAKGKCPVFVGVMDNSIARVVERVESLNGLKIDGVVATTPFYYTVTQSEIKNFFEKIALTSPFPLYIYDLPVVTKVKISIDTIESLMCIDNIKGIKTGDLATARILLRSPAKKDDFSIMFSGLDMFDIAYKYGIKMNIDGMFSMTAPLAAKMYANLVKGNYEEGGKYLDDILRLRNIIVEVGVLRGFSYAMNLLGYEGEFCQDYCCPVLISELEKVKERMIKCKLIL